MRIDKETEAAVKKLMKHFPKREPPLVERAIRQAIDRSESPQDCFLLMRSHEDELMGQVYCTHCGQESILPPLPGWKLKHNRLRQCQNCGETGRVLFSRFFRESSTKEFAGYVETFHQSGDDDGVIGLGMRFRWKMSPKTGRVEVLKYPVEYWYLNARTGEAEQWRRKYSHLFGEEWVKRRSGCRGERMVHGVAGQGYQRRLLPYMVKTDEGFMDEGAFRFCPFKEYLTSAWFGDAMIPAFLELYVKHPRQVELLMKCNLADVAAWVLADKYELRDVYREVDLAGACDDDLSDLEPEGPLDVSNALRFRVNWRCRNHKRIFQGVNLTKQDWKFLTDERREVAEIGLLLMMKRREPARSLAELAADTDARNACAGFDLSTVEVLEMFPSWRQGIKYLMSQQKHWRKEWEKRIGTIAGVYRDYRDYAEKLGLDSRDTAVAKPHNLRRAHDNLMRQWKEAENKALDEKIAKVAAKIQGLAFCEGGLEIRPAAGQKELIDEGKALTHCVGNYGSRYANGKTYILFIRRSSKPDVPFYTAEVSPDWDVVQVRGDHNKGMTPKVQRFVESYKEKVLVPMKRAARRKGRKKHEGD